MIINITYHNKPIDFWKFKMGKSKLTYNKQIKVYVSIILIINEAYQSIRLGIESYKDKKTFIKKLCTKRLLSNSFIKNMLAMSCSRDLHITYSALDLSIFLSANFVLFYYLLLITYYTYFNPWFSLQDKFMINLFI